MKRIIELLILFALLAFAVYVGVKKLAIYYCNEGIKYSNKGLYKEAVVSYKKSLDINPSEADVHNNLAYAYAQIKMNDSAIIEYQKAIFIKPQYLNAYLGLARAYLERRMYQEALDVLKRAQVKFPNNEKIENLTNSVSVEYVSICLERGVDAFLAQDKQKAFVLLNLAQEIRPHFAYTHYTLGFFYFTEKKYREAEKSLNTATQIDSRFWPAYKLLGDIYLEKGEFDKAINEYAAASNIKDNGALLHNDLGIALMHVERYKEAAGYLKKALELEPENLDIRCNLANVYKDAGMFDEAAAEYKKIIETRSDYPNVHNELAVSYSKQGREKDSVEEYRKEIDYSLMRISKDRNDAVALNSLAFAYNGLGDSSKALKIIQKAISIKPNYREAYFTLAAIQEKSGDKDSAVFSLDKAKLLSKQTNFIDKEILRLKKESALILKSRKVFTSKDIVYLKNGRRLLGTVKTENPEEIILEMSAGDSTVTTRISRSAIERIAELSEDGQTNGKSRN